MNHRRSDSGDQLGRARLVDKDLLLSSMEDLDRRYERKEISPVEVARAHLEQLTVVNPMLDAFVWWDEERFLAQARQAEQRMLRQERLGPMDGAVVSIKDTEDIAGAPTTFGSRFLASNIASKDGLVTTRLKRAGALIIGKTTLPQLGYKDMGDNLFGKRCVNPWNRELTAGGSSAGAGASLAAGVGHVAHGNDGGGSVRIPAAFCGLVGVKPSFGRIPFEPAGDRYACRSHQGPLARTVRDASLFIAATAGPDSVDPLAIDRMWSAEEVDDGRRVAGLSIGWVDVFPAYGIDPEVAAVTTAARQVFDELGCRVADAEVTWSDAPEIFAVLYQVSKAYELREWLEDAPEWIEPTLAEMIEQGLATGPERFAAALQGRSRTYDAVNGMFDRYDALVMPATQALPWSAEPGPDEGPGPIGGVGTGRLTERLAFTAPFNMTGHPAAVVPCGMSSSGMPVGLQIVGPWHQDAAVLRLAAAFERVAPWSDWYGTILDRLAA